MSRLIKVMTALAVSLSMALSSWGSVSAGPGHQGGHGNGQRMLEEMREQHRGHTHEHDFKAMEEMSPQQADRMVKLMREIGLAMPPMDSRRGRRLFMEKGCVVCHSVNGVGGDTGPPLNASDMPSPMNAFEFAARMWKGAPAMIVMQEEELGGVIDLTGQDLADLVAFAHDRALQKTVSMKHVPQRWRKKLSQ